MLETIKYIKRNGLKKLSKTFRIKIKRHKKYPDIIQLNYNSLSSNFSQKIVQECRNLIIQLPTHSQEEEEGEIKIISLGFYKFFNWKDPKSDYKKIPNFGKKNVKIYEKIDGSIMMIYYYKNEWNVSSNNLPDGSGVLKSSCGTGKMMSEVFWEIWNEKKYDMPDNKNKNKENGREFCYIFEMVSKENRQIVQYEKDRIVFIGCRNMKNLKEMDIMEMKKKYKYNWEIVKEIQFKSIEEVIEYSKKQLDPLKNEGFVVTFKDKEDDLNYCRVKIKCPQHVYITNLKNIGKTERTKYQREKILLNLILTNESNEFLIYFPDLKDEYEKYEKEFLLFCDFVKQLFEMKKIDVISTNKVLNGVYEKYTSNKEDEDFNISHCIKENYQDYVDDVYKMIKSINYYSIIYTDQLKDVYETIIKNVDKTLLMELYGKLSKEIKKKYKKSKLMLYGSLYYEMSIDNCDLDLCLLNFNMNEKRNLINLLNKMKMKNVKYLDYSNVVKFEYESTKGIIKCDICFKDKNIKKSQIIKRFATYNDKFKELLLLVKYLLKNVFGFVKRNRKIYLNSFSITLMVIYFLQKNSILPKGVTFKKKEVKRIKEGEKIGKLFYEFFKFYSDYDYENEAISIRLSKPIKVQDSKLKVMKDSAVYIEDPIELNENTGRTMRNESKTILISKFKQVCSHMEDNLDINHLFINSTPTNTNNEENEN